MRQIISWIGELGIECALEMRDAYAYTTAPARRDEIEAEAEAARKLGLTAEVLDRAPLPFDTAAALRFPDQAQFNPAISGRAGRGGRRTRRADFRAKPGAADRRGKPLARRDRPRDRCIASMS